jgi:hypothetical protein
MFPHMGEDRASTRRSSGGDHRARVFPGGAVGGWRGDGLGETSRIVLAASGDRSPGRSGSSRAVPSSTGSRRPIIARFRGPALTLRRPDRSRGPPVVERTGGRGVGDVADSSPGSERPARCQVRPCPRNRSSMTTTLACTPCDMGVRPSIPGSGPGIRDSYATSFIIEMHRSARPQRRSSAAVDRRCRPVRQRRKGLTCSVHNA